MCITSWSYSSFHAPNHVVLWPSLHAIFTSITCCLLLNHTWSHNISNFGVTQFLKLNLGFQSCVASAGLQASVATDAEPRLLIDRQTHLSRLSAARELSVPRLSRDGRWWHGASEVSDARNSTVGFLVEQDTWRQAVCQTLGCHVCRSRFSAQWWHNGYIHLWGYKYKWWPALAVAWHPWDLVSMLWEC
jgi:hypothetical protein